MPSSKADSGKKFRKDGEELVSITRLEPWGGIHQQEVCRP